MKEDKVFIPKGEPKQVTPPANVQNAAPDAVNPQQAPQTEQPTQAPVPPVDTAAQSAQAAAAQPAQPAAAPAAEEEKPHRKVTRAIGIIIGIILCLVSIPVIIFNSYIIIQGIVNPNVVPSIGSATPLVVLSDSMYPTIKGGDLIVVDKFEPKNVKQGDTIAYFDPAATSGTAVITHRVIEVTTNNGQLAWKTKGDANSGVDKMPVPASKLVGKYNGTRFEGVGSFCMWLKSVPGIIVCVGIPLVLLVGYDIIRRRMYAKKQQKTENKLREELEALKQQQAGQNAQ